MKKSRNDFIFDVVNNILILILFLIIFYPLYYIVIASISDPTAVNSGEILLIPKGITFRGYRTTLQYQDIWTGYRNTIFYTVVGSLISVSMTLTASYSLSRKFFLGRNFITILFAITMFFSGGLIPFYMVMKNMSMINTVWAQLIPGAVAFFYIIIVRTYYQTTIPAALYDSATIDGCSDGQQFWYIVLPLSKPIIAVLFLFVGVGQWNSYFNAMIFITNRDLFPLQLILREILVLNELSSSLVDVAGDIDMQQMYVEQVKLISLIKYAVIIISSAPVIAVYPFLQKYFVRGMMMGSIKG